VSEQALPAVEAPEASNAVEEASTVVVSSVTAQTEQEPPQDDPPKGEETKPEKTPEQREIDRMRRKIDRLVRQREELRAQTLTHKTHEPDNQVSADDSEPLTLSRTELNRLIEQRAREVAPVVGRQQAAIEHRQSVVEGLARSWGQERFDALASDLDDAFGGLKDGSGQLKPATDAIFEADDPKHLIEYLADPDNAADATRIARLSPVQAGRAIAQLEAKLAQTKAQPKPEPSKVPAPIEPIRGAGNVSSAPSDSDSIEVWLRKERERVAKIGKHHG
jgi:hypothetical protein